jgi:hypothetical protein
VAGALFLRYRSGADRERIDLYFRDGSLSILDAGAPEAEELTALGREVLALAPSEGS